jgi:hypothetical protein
VVFAGVAAGLIRRKSGFFVGIHLGGVRSISLCCSLALFHPSDCSKVKTSFFGRHHACLHHFCIIPQMDFASYLHYQRIIPASWERFCIIRALYLHHFCIIEFFGLGLCASYLHDKCIIPASRLIQTVKSALFVHHLCIIPASVLHHISSNPTRFAHRD